MQTLYYLITGAYFAQAYGQGEYGDNLYSEGGASSGSLTDTGTGILLIISVAAALVFAALLIRFWRRPSSKNKTTEDKD